MCIDVRIVSDDDAVVMFIGNADVVEDVACHINAMFAVDSHIDDLDDD